MKKDAGGGIVCLGASAGGLHSLTTVVAGLPADFPWPILVTQHQSADQPSRLAELLGRHCKLPVREAVDGAPLEPGVVHVCPSTAELGVTPDKRQWLRPPTSGRPQRVDHLFATAAVAAGSMSVAVILSGMGRDGAAGSLVVKLNGGMVVAESAATSEHGGMPKAAVETGTVDAIEPVERIAPLLVSLAAGSLEEQNAWMEAALRDIVAIVSRGPGPDFRRYRLPPLRRRVLKRMALAGVTSIEAYRDLVERDAAERDALVRSLLVAVTEFFRDPEAWEALRHHAIRPLVERVRAGHTVRAWSAGAATGEEAYTLAILFAEELGEEATERVRILATDVDAQAIEHARVGIYSPTRLHDVSPERRASSFSPASGGWRVAEELRGMVEFEVADLTESTPEGPFDLIVCRNVLIYFSAPLQTEMLAKFHDALTPEGVLFLGRSEAVVGDRDRYESLAARMRLFRKLDAPGELVEPQPDDARRGSEQARAVGEALMTSTSLIVLVVDEAGLILLANRQAGRMLGEPRVGEPLPGLLQASSGPSVLEAVRNALAQGRRTRFIGIPVLGPSGLHLDFSVEPFPWTSPAVLVVGHEARPETKESHGPVDVADMADLSATHEELQAANEELAATNEELQAANEELASMHQEHRSTRAVVGETTRRDLLSTLRVALGTSGEPVVVLDATRRTIFSNDAAAPFLESEAPEFEAPAWSEPREALDEALHTSRNDAKPVEVDAAGRAASAGFSRIDVQALGPPDDLTMGWVLRWRRALR